MTNPRPPGGGAGVRESISGQLDWTHDTADASPSVAQRVTHLPAPSRVTAVDHLDAAVGHDRLAGWATRYAASALRVLPPHSVRDGRCTCGTDCKSGSPGRRP